MRLHLQFDLRLFPDSQLDSAVRGFCSSIARSYCSAVPRHPSPVMAAPPSSSAPLDPQPTNGSSLSISHFLSSTPISSPSLSQPSPDPDAQVTAEEDDARLAAAAARGARRSSLQAPGLVQLGGTAFAPTEGAIPGSPDDSPSLGGGVTSLGARGARGEGGEQIGKGEAVLIEFLLVSGKRMRRRIGVESTVREVREGVWRSWPEGAPSLSLCLPRFHAELTIWVPRVEWRGQEELPPSADALRLSVFPLHLSRPFLPPLPSLTRIKPGYTSASSSKIVKPYLPTVWAPRLQPQQAQGEEGKARPTPPRGHRQSFTSISDLWRRKSSIRAVSFFCLFALPRSARGRRENGKKEGGRAPK